MTEELTVTETVVTDSQAALEEFWPRMLEMVRLIPSDDFKSQDLPLARIKKIMKLDDEVKMISAEAPLLFAKAAEIFIHELTLRAWIHTEDNKRRTLQRNDIAMAIARCDQFDFLIDIVPRDEVKPAPRQPDGKAAGVLPDQVQYYIQLAQQQAALQQQQQQQAAAAAATQQQPQSIQIISGGQVQTIQIIPASQTATAASNSEAVTVSSGGGGGSSTGGATVHLQVNAQGQLVQTTAPPTAVSAAAAQPPQPAVQIIQQVVGADGQIQQVPLQLNSSQLQMLRLAGQTASSNQPQTVVLQPSQAQQVLQGQQVFMTTQQE